MKILITTWSLAGRSGAELYAFELGLALIGAGHRVAIYAVAQGALARKAKALGLDVFSDCKKAPFVPDTIHGHHQGALVDAMLAFTASPAIFVVHDATAAQDDPIVTPRICRYVAVDNRCLKRISAIHEIAPDLQIMLPNFVDMKRFRPRGPLPVRPRRALLFSNYAMRTTHLPAVLGGCAIAGLAVDVLGSGVRNATDEPEAHLGSYDLVFAKARCAMEAMAVGAAVILCDFPGLGPSVTTRNFDTLRAWNFGTATLNRPLEAALVAQEIHQYDAAESTQVSARMRNEAGLEHAVIAWMEIYRQVLSEFETAVHRDDCKALQRYRSKWSLEKASLPLIRQVKRIRALPFGAEIYDFVRQGWRTLSG